MVHADCPHSNWYFVQYHSLKVILNSFKLLKLIQNIDFFPIILHFHHFSLMSSISCQSL